MVCPAASYFIPLLFLVSFSLFLIPVPLVGQFRDLLLLFRAYGYPSHLKGDVECVRCV